MNLPCTNGTIYTGANVGIVTQSNLPTAILTSTVPTNYALSTNSNGTTLTGSQGCTIQYLRFSGTQGGIIVWYPASGIVIQDNAFDNDNPPAGGETSETEHLHYRPEWGLLRSQRCPAYLYSMEYCFSTTVPRFEQSPTLIRAAAALLPG